MDTGNEVVPFIQSDLLKSTNHIGRLLLFSFSSCDSLNYYSLVLHTSMDAKFLLQSDLWPVLKCFLEEGLVKSEEPATVASQ